jgi:non-homologous end joining protein Ku
MAPRANWKGFLRLSLVTCPVALYPATSDSEKISFNQINRKTGHRIKYAKVDADNLWQTQPQLLGANAYLKGRNRTVMR